MSSLSTGAAAWLLTYLVHSTVLLGLAWGVGRLRRGTPAQADVLWKVALVGAVLTATVQTGLQLEPAGSVRFISAADAGSPAPLGQVEIPAPGPQEIGPVASDPVIPESATPGDARLTSPAAGGATSSDGIGLLLAGILAWGIVALGLTAWYAGRRLVLVGRLGDRRTVQDPGILQLLAGLRGELGIRRRVTLTSSTAISSPVAIGAGEICLPTAALVDLDPPQQRAMLAHELAHLHRRDPQWLSFACVMERVFFFQPMNRLARRQIQETAEYLADETAARLSGGVPLARCLVKVAEWIQASPLGVPVAGMAEQRSQLSARVSRLLEGHGLTSPRRQPVLGMLSLGVLVITTVFVPGAIGRGESAAGTDPSSAENTAAQDDNAEVRTGESVFTGISVDTNTDLEVSQGTDTESPSPSVSPSASAQTRALSGKPGHDTTVVQAIIARLKDEDPEVRQAAAHALGQLGQPVAIPALVAALDDPEPDVREAALDALSSFERGVPAAPIRRFLAAENSNLRMQALEILGEMRDRESAQAIARLLNDPNADVRHQALHALGHIRDPGTIPAMIGALNDPNADVRMTAVEELSEMGGTIPDATLGRLLQDQNADVRRETVSYIEERRVISVTPMLVRMLDDGNRDVRRAVAEALSELRTPEADAALRRALNHADPQVRRIAVEYLGEQGDN